MKIFKKNDNVIVIAGSDKGKIGKLIAFYGDERVIVEGVNIATVHKKATSSEAGKVVRIEKSIHISNISHVENNSPAKVKFTMESGAGKAFAKKIRILSNSGKKI